MRQRTTSSRISLTAWNGSHSKWLARLYCESSCGKSINGPDLILARISTLTSELLKSGLADEILLRVNPVLLGIGKRFFAENTPARSIIVHISKSLPSGILVNACKAAGPSQTSNPAPIGEANSVLADRLHQLTKLLISSDVCPVPGVEYRRLCGSRIRGSALLRLATCLHV